MKKIKEQKNKLTLKTPINLQRKIDEIFKLIMKEKDEEKFKKYVLEIKNNTKKLFENLLPGKQNTIVSGRFNGLFGGLLFGLILYK